MSALSTLALIVPYWKLLGFALYVTLYINITQAHVDYPEETMRSAFYKVLPITQLILTAYSTDTHKDPEFIAHQRGIVLGLLASVAGDVCLIWRHDLFIPGLLCFAVAQMCYLCAFGVRPMGPAPTLASAGILAAFAYAVIQPGIKDQTMNLLVAGYIVLIFAMGWRAAVHYQRRGNFGAFCGILGAAFFIISDFIIAYDKFRAPIQQAHLAIMVTYLAAQLGLTFSVTSYSTGEKLKGYEYQN